MIIAASRRLVELSNHVRNGHWTRNIGEDLFGWDVHGKTLGVMSAALLNEIARVG
jgi:phosphogluconate 2-dehydrogenase/gluconate 2-dehydrogenase